METENCDFLNRDEIGALRCHDVSEMITISEMSESEIMDILNCKRKRANEIIRSASEVLTQGSFSTEHTSVSTKDIDDGFLSQGWYIDSWTDEEIYIETENSVYQILVKSSNSKYTIKTTLPTRIGETQGDYILKNKGIRRFFRKEDSEIIQRKLDTLLDEHRFTNDTELEQIDHISTVHSTYFDVRHDITTIDGLKEFSENYPIYLSKIFGKNVYNVHRDMTEN